MSHASQMLQQQEAELQRIRRKRKGNNDHAQARRILNITFLILAAVGLLLYFSLPANRAIGLGTIGIGMLLKIVELFLRFMM